MLGDIIRNQRGVAFVDKIELIRQGALADPFMPETIATVLQAVSCFATEPPAASAR